MNNDLLNAILNAKKEARRKDGELRALHATQKAAGAEIKELNKIVDAIREVQSDFKKAKQDESYYKTAYEKLNASSTEADKKAAKEKLTAIESALATKYGVELEELIPVLEDDEELAVSEEEVENVVAPKEGLGKKIAKWGLLTVGAIGLVGTAVHTGLLIGDRICEDNEDEKDKDEDLELGEYGTFKDITDQEQVEARAQYLYDEYFSDFVGQLPAGDQALVTPEKLANIIRVLNGELPLDSEGNKYFDANLVDDFGQAYVKIVCDLPSSPNLDKIYHVPSHLFTIDGSDLSNFMKAYDTDYANIAEGRNNRDGEKTRDAIASLGQKMWDQWVLQGMHEGPSPYDLPASQRNLAFLGTMAPYAPYAFEYNLNAMQPVCIEACVNYSTKEKMEITVSEIYKGYTSGLWDTVIAKAAGLPIEAEPDSIAFHQDLTDQLEYQQSQLVTKKLN